jgi:alanyl-tRNA synthetase
MSVIKEEENSFLHTLETGMKLLDQIIQKTKNEGRLIVSGKIAFELYDTFGFPVDLTELILKENSLTMNTEEFEAEMNSQKTRSRAAAVVDTGDWTILSNIDKEEFIGYDFTESDVMITRYRKVKYKEKELYQLVFNITPFYAESGGQLGDSGNLISDNEKIDIINTIKENNLIIHISEKLPSSLTSDFKAKIDVEKRRRTQNNHSATHLLHKALRDILGSHVEQKGSLVGPEYLRFDFSHFQKMSVNELKSVELNINSKIRDNLLLEEKRNYPVDEAKKLGAMMLFGEKYGDSVRVVKFGDSIELCGGTHVQATGQIGYLKIISEGAIAAGIRRIEAITGPKAEEYFNEQLNTLQKIRELLGNPVDLVKVLENKLDDYGKLSKQIEQYQQENQNHLANELISKSLKINNISFICEKVNIASSKELKNLAMLINNQINDACIVLAAETDNKANLVVAISKNLVESKNLNASDIIREISGYIDGSGGGQAFLATAGGKNPKGLGEALEHAKIMVSGKK